VTNYPPVAIKVAAQQMTELRQRLEREILEKLQQFERDTGLTPARIELETTDVSQIGCRNQLLIDRVRVVVEV
jgi:hypothetical protein